MHKMEFLYNQNSENTLRFNCYQHFISFAYLKLNHIKKILFYQNKCQTAKQHNDRFLLKPKKKIIIL